MGSCNYRILSLSSDKIGHLKDKIKDIKELRKLLKEYSPIKSNTDNVLDNFKSLLNDSLDVRYIKEVYKKRCRNKWFSISDKNDNKYTFTVISVKLNKTNSKEKDFCRKIYKEGFDFWGSHFVRYKRSASESRLGKCLFIDERLYKDIAEWSECGIKNKAKDLASYEAYKALTISSIVGTLSIKPENILFVDDYEYSFDDDVVCIKMKNNKLIAEECSTTITNNIWDGESLLDENCFQGDFANKHFILLRNKFFKSCAFRTKLQQWFADNNITSVQQLKELGMVTLANDVSQIKLVTTPSSLKYLKFASELTEENVCKWGKQIDCDFGIVKYDKRTKYFDGRMMRSSYQLLNTMQIDEDTAESIVDRVYNYIKLLRDDVAFMRYHLQYAYKAEKNIIRDEDYEENYAENLNRAELLIELLQYSDKFSETKLYIDFRNDIVEKIKNETMSGKLLFDGIYPTLFGNGPELLLATVGKFDRNNAQSLLKPQTVRSEFFADGADVLISRSPHITMGNLYLAKNDLSHNSIWDYFDLGENIVCVNAIGDNIQHRLNGCDYDSDTVFITNDTVLVSSAMKNIDKFKVPVCKLKAQPKLNNDLFELDSMLSNNKIGEIVNLSQKLNSKLWDNVNQGQSVECNMELYRDICKLAVLSGIEIDKAKRNYNVNTAKEMNAIKEKYYPMHEPEFFKTVKKSHENFKGNNAKTYFRYKTSMQFFWEKAKSKLDFRKGKKKEVHRILLNSLLNDDLTKKKQYYLQNQLIKCCEDYKTEMEKFKPNNNDNKRDDNVVLVDIEQLKLAFQKKAESIISKEPNVIRLVLESFESKKHVSWNLCYPILSSPIFKQLLRKEKIREVIEDPNGNYNLYNYKFKII